MAEGAKAAKAEQRWNDALNRLAIRIKATLNSQLGGFPHYADPDTAAWTTSPDGFWTGGFWVGELWLAAHYFGGDNFGRAAEQWLQRLSPRIHSKSVFRGFLFFYGATLGAELFGNQQAREIGMAAAKSLAAAFDPVARLIPLGAEAEESHTVGTSESNIDGLIASALLLWAAKGAGKEELRRIAVSHALRNAEFCVQPDGSVIQSASFDPTTGTVTRRYTHKGYAPNSIWGRAQAWAMLGYSLCAGFLPDEAGLLTLAMRVSDWWIANTPGDWVAYWDFSAPKGHKTFRDTSATAIAAASLLRLSALCPDHDKAQFYGCAARKMVEALITRHLTPTGPFDHRSVGILADGCFDPRNGLAVRNELIWGDYFLLEALGFLAERISPGILADFAQHPIGSGRETG